MFLQLQPIPVPVLALVIIITAVPAVWDNSVIWGDHMKKFICPEVVEISELYGRGNNTCTSSGSGNNNNPCSTSGKWLRGDDIVWKGTLSL